MGAKLAYWGSVIFSGIALILIIANIAMSNANRTMQADVAQRQQTIATGQTLSNLNQSLVQALAEAAYKNSNTQLRDLLMMQGITVKSEAAAPGAKPAEKNEKK
jgi:galactitol-specific phosphotransferase system IIC component